MSIDLVEIALDNLTDGALFEKLAAEIMRDEGYHDIIRLGGVHDHGIDAVEDVLYEYTGRARTIFQFTLEDYVLGKLHDTVTKLTTHNIAFSQLILVTRTSLSAQRHRTLITEARKSYDITLLVYDRKTIVNRLADLENGIFHRLFPSIQQQLATILSSRPTFMEGDSVQELAMLKTAITFVLSPEAGAVRKSLFDRMVTSALASQPGKPMTVSTLTDKIREYLGAQELQEPQVSASLGRLRTTKAVEVLEEGFVLTDAALTAASSSTIKVNRMTESLISDVVEEIAAASSARLSVEQRRRLERNATLVLKELLRLNSIEVASLSEPGTTPVAPFVAQLK